MTPATAEPLVRVSGLGFAYETTPVLDVDELSVYPGDVAVLTGHNGSGKTTLLKIVNGLLQPGSGEVKFAGSSISTQTGRSLLRARSVLVHQKPYLFHESVASNIRYVVNIREPRAPDVHERIRGSLAAVRLEGFEERRANGLSGGERQRVAIARALAVRPSLLLLDEPTSNIDPASIRAIEAALREANAGGTTILMTTHNLATAYRLATRVFPMSAGRLEADPNNVFHGEIDHTDEYFTYFRIAGTGDGDGGPGGAARPPGAAGPGGTAPSRVLAPAQNHAAEAAVIPMDDIIISRERIESSAQNHFAGVVTAVVPFGGGRRVDVEAAGTVFSALVTRYAVEQLDLEPGHRVHLAFKASAVKLY